MLVHCDTLGKSAFFVKAHLPSHLPHYARMNFDAASVLSVNLAALMSAHEGLGTQAAVAKRSGMDQRTVGRILNREHSPTLRQIDGLAAAFGLLPWQLLVPQLDALNPPAVSLTMEERDLYDRLTSAVAGIAKLPR